MNARLWLGSMIVISAFAAVGCSGAPENRADGGGPGSDAEPDDAAVPPDAAVAPSDGSVSPPDFWDTSNIPAAKNVMMFKFLNRTNGKFKDSEVFWSFKTGSISETHSIAEQRLYDMPANASGRMYFYICSPQIACTGDPTKSPYFDFIEHTIGPGQYNGNTTRVDAFGLKIAMRLHCADGSLPCRRIGRKLRFVRSELLAVARR